MEELLHYVWKHKILPLQELKTSDGRTVEVINPGLHNKDAGPDFLDAKVKIDGMLWVGNVEIHVRTSDWFRHGHDKDVHYDNIILHVALEIDQTLHYPDGNEIPQLQVAIPDYIRDNYDSLLRSDQFPRCSNVVGNIPRLIVHNWMNSLQIERLEVRTKQIMERRDKLNMNWEDTLFVTIARSFGFGKNGDAFEQWAQSIPMGAVGKHRDNLFQIEAIFFGQAGLLEDDAKGKEIQGKTEDSDKLINTQQPDYPDYYVRLAKEYKYLRQKFSLTPINAKIWKFARLRPQNFPHIRIAQLAMLYYSQQMNLSKLINADSIEKIQAILSTQVSEFWRSHYTFTSDVSEETDKQLTKSSIHLIIINSVAPILFAYGRYKGEDSLCEKAYNLWENIKPEKNHIITEWANAGITAQHAGDTQALLQLTHNYCERHDCLRCRFGYEFISKNPDFLREEVEKD